ncbi:MAG: acyltransferase [Planctomycetota bacterium]
MRNLGLDLLRLLAVILVLGRHMRPPEDPSLFMVAWKTGGWVGVDLFFVLSGFLVSGLLYKAYQRDQALNVKRFLVRRAFKIYPAFYLLLFTTLIVRAFGGEPILVAPLIGELLFLQNYLGGLWNHTWSLAVEEHFYLLIAALFTLLVSRYKRNNDSDQTRTNPFNKVPHLFVCIALVCLGFRIAAGVTLDHFSYPLLLLGTHIRIDSLMFGVFLSYLWHFRDLEQRIQPIRSIWLVLIGAALLTPAFIFPLNDYWLIPIIGVTGFYLGSGALVLAFIRIRQSSNIALVGMGSLGAASYSIYLWHMAVESWGWDWFTLTTGIIRYEAYFVVYMVGSLVLGWVLSQAVEWPVLKLRDRLFPRQS